VWIVVSFLHPFKNVQVPTREVCEKDSAGKIGFRMNFFEFIPLLIGETKKYEKAESDVLIPVSL
jgi:hypothetical protein